MFSSQVLVRIEQGGVHASKMGACSNYKRIKQERLVITVVRSDWHLTVYYYSPAFILFSTQLFGACSSCFWSRMHGLLDLSILLPISSPANTTFAGHTGGVNDSRLFSKINTRIYSQQSFMDNNRTCMNGRRREDVDVIYK
jgi:hypothetical protein